MLLRLAFTFTHEEGVLRVAATASKWLPIRSFELADVLID